MTTIRIAPPASRKLCTLGSVRVLGEDRIGLSTADLVRISSRPIASLGGASGSHPRVKRKGGGYATRFVARLPSGWNSLSLSLSPYARTSLLRIFEGWKTTTPFVPKIKLISSSGNGGLIFEFVFIIIISSSSWMFQVPIGMLLLFVCLFVAVNFGLIEKFRRSN